MKRIPSHSKAAGPALSNLCLIGLSLCFLAGVFIGQAFILRMPGNVGAELKGYLQHIMQYGLLRKKALSTVSSTCYRYFRYPLLVTLLSLTPAGIILIPTVLMLYGFSLSYTSSCFYATFSVDGILLVAALLGLRTLFVLPCIFLLAVPAWKKSRSLLYVKKPLLHRIQPEGADLFHCVLCIVVLAVGCCLESSFISPLLQYVLERILR